MTKTAVIADIRARYEGCKGQFDRITNNAWRLHADIGALLAMVEGRAREPPHCPTCGCGLPAEPKAKHAPTCATWSALGGLPCTCGLAERTDEPRDNHPCAHKGCTALISSRVKYCEDHEPTSALQARFTCEGKYCHRSFVIKYQPGAKIMGASCVCGHYTEFKEPALRTS